METGQETGTMGQTVVQQESTYGHIVKNTGFLGVIQMLAILVGVIRNKLAAVLLGTVGMGLSSLYMNVTGFLQNSSNLGISFSSIKEIAECYEQGNREAVCYKVEVVRTWSLWTGVLGALLCLLLSPVISFCAFDDYSYTLQLALLSLAVVFMTVTMGEISILKAVRRLKRVALVAVLAAVVTLMLTIPFYYLWGIGGVAPALVCSSFGVMVVHLSMSATVFPWKVAWRSRNHFREGWSLIRVGVPYILATMVNMAVGLGLSVFIKKAGSLSDVGLYGMGYNLIFTYAGVIFTAVDTDFFPRLSAVNADVERMNVLINRQVKVGTLLIAPILIVFMLAMPLAIRILYSSDFLPMTGMAVCAALHMYFKAMTLPVAYMSLAKGDGGTFFCMESAYDFFMAMSVVVGYLYGGILGTGVALALSGIFDWMMIRWVYARKYGFRSEKSSRMLFVCQFLCVSATLALCLFYDGWCKVSIGMILLSVSLILSWRAMRKDMFAGRTWRPVSKQNK